MARTATRENEVETKEELTAAVHHMVRGLGAMNDGNGIFTSPELDIECQKWLDQGYRLAFVDAHYNPQGMGQGGYVNDTASWHILYVFTRG